MDVAGNMTKSRVIGRNEEGGGEKKGNICGTQTLRGLFC